MLRHFFYLLLSLTIYSQPAYAEFKSWGLGAMLSNPTGLSGKHRFSNERSVDLGLGYSLSRNSSFHIHSTYIWEFNESIEIDQVRIGHYFGVGGGMHARDRDRSNPGWARSYPGEEFGLSARGVAGLNYYFKEPAIEVFTEAALHVFVLPGTHGHLGLALGGRYFF